MKVYFPPIVIPLGFEPTRRIALWDIDTCIADDRWRLPFINFDTLDMDERYHEYHVRSPADKPANLEVFNAISQVARPVFLTARPEGLRAATSIWLTRHMGVKAPIILMRPEGTPVPSVPLKRAMVERLYHTFADLRMNPGVYAALDDREDIVEMYRGLGFPGIVLKAHDGCAYTNPKDGVKHSL